MRNIINSERISKAVELAQDFLYNEDFEDGSNSTTLRDAENRIEVDVELRCEHNLKFDSGSHLVPPSASGKITNRPVSIIAWFFNDEDDDPIERDITNQIESYTYAI